MSEKVCLWCQRGYPLHDGKHYVVGADRGCVASSPAAPLSTLPEGPAAVNFVQRGMWMLCLHCRNVYQSEHFCGAPWQTPDARPFPNGIPQEWVDEIRARRSRLSSLERELDGVRSIATGVDALSALVDRIENVEIWRAGPGENVVISEPLTDACDAKEFAEGPTLRDALCALTVPSALRERSE